MQRSPLILSITTRGIGINLCSFYNNVVRLLPTTAYTTAMGIPKYELANIYASYRALLALVESRFLNLDRIAFYNENMYKYTHVLKEHYNIMNIPNIFKRLLEAIDVLQYNGIIYIPAMAKNTVIKGKFIPRPENIILSNLRQTVEALTGAPDDDDHCTLVHRENFYKYNPIPGAIWNDNYELMNANEIIPPEYDLRNDVYDDMNALLSLSMQLRKYSNYFNKDCTTRKVTRTSFSSFICNEMGDLRVPDRESEESLYDYYCHSSPKNNIDSFYSCFKLRNEQVIKEGALFLLGECPNDESIAKPIYELRSEHVNSYYYASYSYKTSYLSYHNDVVAKTLQNA